jgi:hypothetical protein
VVDGGQRTWRGVGKVSGFLRCGAKRDGRMQRVARG